MRSKNTLHMAEAGLTAALMMGASACAGTGHESDPDNGMSKLVAGCKIFTLYAQNRFQPYGVAVRTVPDIRAAKSETFHFAPNEAIPIDGWEHTGTVAYPAERSARLRSDVWYHVAPLGTSGKQDVNPAWVSFAGVRATPTVHDQTGGFSNNLGRLAPTPASCEIKPPIDVPR